MFDAESKEIFEKKNKKVAIMLVIAGLLIVLLGYPIFIACIVLGVQKPGACDHKDDMGLDVGDWLLGTGITYITLITILLGKLFYLYMSGMKYGSTSKILDLILIIASALFGIAWTICGGVILFRSNIDCINDGSNHVIFALVIWCFSVLNHNNTIKTIKKSWSDRD